jgi:hypothetical protein
MAFEESPRFNGNQVVTHLSTQGWIHKHRLVLMLLVVIFLILDGFLFYYRLVPAVQAGRPGGLDGCLVSANGEPLSAIVRVGQEASQTFEDGCFFFSELPPGAREITIEAVSGERMVQTVEIISGEAVGLGTVTVP